MPRQYNVFDTPKGKAKRRHLPTITAEMRRRAEHDSFVGTCKLRHSLTKTRVREVRGTWCHVNAKGVVVAIFPDVGAAVAAL